MKAVLQRVKSASVKVDGKVIGKIKPGILILLGVAKDDQESDIDWLMSKIINLRIFPNEMGKFDRSLLDTQGEVLVVSQFTLYGDCRKGRRPSFDKAALPEKGLQLYLKSVEWLKNHGIKTETGEFGAMMDVELINDGPVTILLDSAEK